MDVETWCAQNNLTKANYYYRLRRVREACLEQVQGTTSAAFVELPFPTAASSESPRVPGTVISDGPIAEIAKANNLKSFGYFECLLTEIPKHTGDKNTDFLEELLPWSKTLPAHIRKPKKAEEK